MENMELNQFSFPALIKKTGEETNGRIPVEIIPNKPTIDRVNDKILLKAFDDDCIKSFIYDGVIDYDHISILGSTPVERATAIIGEPQKLFIDSERGVPVCHGFLFKGNPYVDNAIMPALRNGSKIFGASLGGKILQKSSDVDKATKKKINSISKISLKHIAITPLQKAVHQETSVSLIKSFNGDENYEIQFSSYDEFLKSFSDVEFLNKALEAGSVTNIANLSGGQAVQMQSIEGDKKKKNVDYRKIRNAIPFIMDSLVSGNLKGNYSDYQKYFEDKGFNKEEAEEIIKLIATNSASIAKLTF